ncbi:MAG: helix-turn-helix domain-containing protein [Cellulosilyticaceae bacterium]
MKKLENYLEFIALQDFTTYHYKALLILMYKPKTQSMICEKLGIQKQQINKVFKHLEGLGFIEVERVEGRNKFYKVVTDQERINSIIPGQTKF